MVTCLCCNKNPATDEIVSFTGRIKLPVCRECKDHGCSSYIGNTDTGPRMGLCCTEHPAEAKCDAGRSGADGPGGP